MSGIVILIHCINISSKLDAYDHKFLGLFRDGYQLFYQMALTLHYKSHNDIPITAKEVTKFMKTQCRVITLIMYR